MQELTQEPQGIGFYNIKSDETHYAKLEPTIQAYINSSDMGINASRDQDFGWRLQAEWVKRVRAFRRDNTQMQILTARNGGQKPSTVQVLYYLYGEELRAYQEELEEHENPFEDKYQQQLREGSAAPAVAVADDDSDISDLVDDADLEPGDAPAPVAAAKPAKQSQK